MKPIHDIEYIPPEAIELFEAAGYMDAEAILNHQISDITIELIKANNVLEIIDTEPTREMVIQWIQPIEAKFSKSIKGHRLEVDPSIIINSGEVMAKPFIVPVSQQFLIKNNIDISDLPEGKLSSFEKEQADAFLSEIEAPLLDSVIVPDQNLDENSDQNEDSRTAGLYEKSSTQKKSNSLDLSRVIKTETYQREGSLITPIANNEGINHIKSTSTETNKGVNPKSRFYIKGVLHRNAFRFKSGCYSFILVNLLLFLSFGLTSLVLVNRDKYSWAVWAPLLGVLSILIYFGFAQRSACPVCNQKQFAPKVCRKHKSAHHWPIFGYMLPTAIHALLLKWFRCIFCGTSIRLKK